MLEGLLAGLAVAAGAVALPAPGLPAGPVQYGVNAQYLFTTAPQDQWGRQLDAMRATGLKVVRQDAEWAGVEPQPPAGGRHAYHWEQLDAIAGELARHGLRWRPIVDYSAPWAAAAEGNTKSPPRDDAAFAAYAGALAARYGAGGSFWRAHPGLPNLPVTAFEIWNEPDCPRSGARRPTPRATPASSSRPAAPSGRPTRVPRSSSAAWSAIRPAS